MANKLPTEAASLDLYEDDLIKSLETERSSGCDPHTIQRKSELYAEAVGALLAQAPDHRNPQDTQAVDSYLPLLEKSYLGWKSVNQAFEDTIRLAYTNAVPRKNLLIDQAFSELLQNVGEPLADRYITLKSRWRNHLTDHPWDAYKESTPSHVDSEKMDECLNALIRGDDLDVEDALNDLTGNLRHAFIDFMENNPDSIVDFESGLWKRPEILIAGDFWQRGRKRRMFDILAEKTTPRFATAFSTIRSFFELENSPGSAYSPRAVADSLQKVPIEQRARFYRCLMLHPDYELRRYAVSNSSLASAWKALTPNHVPCATVLSVLEQLVSSSRFNTTQRKIFFDAVYRRLLNVTTRSDVLYSRGIVRILSKLSFFLEDEYFAKMMALLDYLEAKEKYFKIDDATMREYTDTLKREKQRVGNVETEAPVFDDVPLVILRKLARDGHFWDLLSMHPIVKIARETVAHISTRDRAMVVACNHRVNQEVLRSVGRRHSMFPTLRARLTLLGNPRTPPGISMEYLSDLTKNDVERLLRQPGIHPELRTMLRNQYNRRRR
jgi:hypothetical protein